MSLDLLKMGAAGALGFALAWATTKDGIATGRRGFEIALENRAAISNNKLIMEKGFRSITTSIGMRMKPMVETQKEISKAVAVLTEAQARAETASRERDERIEIELRDWQIRERTKP